jgi:hypothetical protein
MYRRLRSQGLTGATDAQPTDRIYSLYFRGEQVPDLGNRIVLSEHLDALGRESLCGG